MAFQGHIKSGVSLLHNGEERLKRALLPRVPRGVETYHLTLTTVLWSALIPLFCYVARDSIHWLWAVNACIVGQYITDLLDGAVGRARNTGLKRWGYYVDHFLDYIFLGAIFYGYAVLLPAVFHKMLLFTMVMFTGFMIHAFLEFACTNRFSISYLGVGPTEIRLLFIAINVLLIVFGKTYLAAALPYVVMGSLFGLFATVCRTARKLWQLDMIEKHTPS
jgi:archaetidylinositol phosphate synthase